MVENNSSQKYHETVKFRVDLPVIKEKPLSGSSEKNTIAVLKLNLNDAVNPPK